ncbi:hypothetical protein RU92_GL001192 [Lactococcus cremoris subsp. tructae]|uniref:Uncharacterized protein n=1 Tax=Lactococcus cremoris subsp. tructae TaxID=542833 RepID=A0A2A5SPI9_LACLC|nr:hypothetical protein RU92_GL001192 [Lactococcus cremoris subsp. tructae]
MVGIFAVMRVDVRRNACVIAQRTEKFLGHFAVVTAELGISKLWRVKNEIRAPADVEVGRDQRLVHGNRETAIARTSAPLAKRFVDTFTQRNGNVLGDVVWVHARRFVVAVRGQPDVHVAVESEKRQHVVEKADTCRDVGLTYAVEIDVERDLGFFCVAGNV